MGGFHAPAKATDSTATKSIFTTPSTSLAGAAIQGVLQSISTASHVSLSKRDLAHDEVKRANLLTAVPHVPLPLAKNIRKLFT